MIWADPSHKMGTFSNYRTLGYKIWSSLTVSIPPSSNCAGRKTVESHGFYFRRSGFSYGSLLAFVGLSRQPGVWSNSYKRADRCGQLNCGRLRWNCFRECPTAVASPAFNAQRKHRILRSLRKICLASCLVTSHVPLFLLPTGKDGRV